MEFSWDLLESTLKKVGNVLGDSISDIEMEQQMSDQLVHSDCGISLDVIDEHMADIMNEEFQFHNPGQSEDILPQSRARSNTWPKLQIGIGLVQMSEVRSC